ncbi:hypothetical protein ACFPIJ_07630 [Dactylosporangium cerinum]|uniref:Halobacterial output domain-containing protein n=1 Tax=Dactylosporangium cerinum TaxID=1434730 RepID=A0ABV9VR02_9ACTN
MQLDSRPAVVDCALHVGGVRQSDDLPLAELYRYLPHGELTDTSEVIDTGSIRMFFGQHFVVTVRHGEAGELRHRADHVAGSLRASSRS